MLSLIPMLALSIAQPPPPPPACDVVSIEVSTDGGLTFRACPSGQSLNACGTLTFRVTTKGSLTSLAKLAMCDSTTQTPILGSEMHTGDTWTFAYNVTGCGPCLWSIKVTPTCGGTTGQAKECRFNLTKDGCQDVFPITRSPTARPRHCECTPCCRFPILRGLLGR